MPTNQLNKEHQKNIKTKFYKISFKSFVNLINKD